MKQKFDIIKSTCVPLPLENIDTDQIIPARFLKATTREGFGDNLFRDWRYDKNGNPISSFVLTAFSTHFSKKFFEFCVENILRLRLP